ASTVAIQYRKTINKPSPIANVIINNNIKEKIILDGNFEEDWGDCLYLQKIINTDVKQKYKIEIEITQATEEDKEPFYLLSLIIS
ncbi:MAG: SGNH/GDSL hydrolase family protein, partial [Eubacteriales bacterium]|nr:SGNH/GDSL hydrolase family protein [Eubacteriales bacterium]